MDGFLISYLKGQYISERLIDNNSINLSNFINGIYFVTLELNGINLDTKTLIIQ